MITDTQNPVFSKGELVRMAHTVKLEELSAGIDRMQAANAAYDLAVTREREAMLALNRAACELDLSELRRLIRQWRHAEQQAIEKLLELDRSISQDLIARLDNITGSR